MALSTLDSSAINLTASSGTGNIVLSANPTFTGSVGVGTASPIVKFDVNGNARLGANYNTDTDSSTILDGGTFVLCAAGTQSLKTQFEIDGSTTYINANQYYSNSSWQVYDSTKAPAAIWLTNTSSNSYITLRTSATNSGVSNERLRVDANGNIGIGTTSPYAKLDVSGTGGTGSAVLNLTGSTNHIRFNDTAGGSDLWLYRSGGDNKLRLYGTGGDRIYFYGDTGKIYCQGIQGGVASLSASLTTTSSSAIVANTNTMAFFNLPNARYSNGDSTVFQINTGGNGGVTILKSGWIFWNYSQDVRWNSTSAYIPVYALINGLNTRSQLTAPSPGGSSYWASALHSGTAYMNANDVLTFQFAGANYAALDTSDWSYLSILWIGG